MNEKYCCIQVTFDIHVYMFTYARYNQKILIKLMTIVSQIDLKLGFGFAEEATVSLHGIHPSTFD